MKDNFSILLILKDRVPYTIRIMEYWNSIHFPYEIIIADGGKSKAIEDFLKDKNNLTNINYKYIRYPYDEGLDDFYRKMDRASSEISTATVSVMDNDDFILTEGISKCLDILRDKKYSSARGAMHEINGNLSITKNMYKAYPDSIKGNSARDRMIDQTSHFHGNWHNVTRSNHIKAEWKMINISRPNNFRIVEQVTGYLNAIWGDGYRGSFPWLLHQHGERIATEKGTLAAHFPDQQTWINSSYWLEEFNKLTEIVGAAISYYDKTPIDDAMKIFRESYHLKLPNLKDLLDTRILEASSIGYDKDRISRLLNVLEECEVESCPDIAGETPAHLPAAKEIELIQNCRTR